MAKNIQKQPSKSEKDIILEFIALGRGHVPEKKQLAKQLGIKFNTLKYRVNKFKDGEGVGRKIRADKGIPKKDPEIKTKLEFFAELAMGASIDEATEKFGLTEHQGNRLAKEFKTYDKFKALRNAPQLDDLREVIKDLFRLDIAIVVAEMNGAFNVHVKEKVIPIAVKQIGDIQDILAYCLQVSEMGEIDSSFKHISDDDLMNIRLNYLKHELTEKKNVTELTRLLRATKESSIGKIDLKLVYNIIERFLPGSDEKEKITIIREEAARIKNKIN